jgi:hypothetical protein
MLKPTQDEKLKQRLIEMMDNVSKLIEPTSSKQVAHDSRVIFIEMVLEEIEKRGYSKGLPDSIEWALNSGDGTYRP